MILRFLSLFQRKYPQMKSRCVKNEQSEKVRRFAGRLLPVRRRASAMTQREFVDLCRDGSPAEITLALRDEKLSPARAPAA